MPSHLPTPPTARNNGDAPVQAPVSVAGETPGVLQDAHAALGAGHVLSATEQAAAADAHIQTEIERANALNNERLAALLKSAKEKTALYRTADAVGEATNMWQASRAAGAAGTAVFSGARGLVEGFFGKDGAETLCAFLTIMEAAFKQASEMGMAVAEKTLMESIDNSPLDEAKKKAFKAEWDKYKKGEGTAAQAEKPKDHPAVSSAKTVKVEQRIADRNARTADDDRGHGR